MINWINTAENLGITIIGFVAGVLLGAFVTFHITDTIIQSNQKVLIEAIHKPSTVIDNDYDIKNKKGELVLAPKNTINDTVYHKKWYQIFKK